jgi:uncharacterized membrane protein YfcA
VGCVLLYIGTCLLKEILFRNKKSSASKAIEEKFKARVNEIRQQQVSTIAAGLPVEAVVKTVSISLKRIEYEFWGERFSFNTIGMFMLALVVGIVGGAYGIGGGAIIAPFCVAVFHLPVYTIAGAALMGTFITSVAGALFFSIIPATGGVPAMTDWPLGILFGIGGFAGMYLGARFQKFVPQKFIKLTLGIAIVFLAIIYIVQYF